MAHLIVQGADPRRMMLLTFSRRAAVEMTRRVERIAAQVLPDQARLVADALTWSGTFHAIGARLLREYAEQIGLERAFTIHDREDSADLMNLVRHDLGFSKTEERFPAKNTCLAIYSRVVNAEAGLMRFSRTISRGASTGRMNSKPCSAPTSRPSSAIMSSITTICCFTGRR